MPGYYFNLPQITDLTTVQQVALDEPNPIAISGGPGTGKSVVSLWRHISNYVDSSTNNQSHPRPRKKSLLLTFTTTLTQYLTGCCRTISPAAADNVRTSVKGKPRSSEHWDEIIIDEADRLAGLASSTLLLSRLDSSTALTEITAVRVDEQIGESDTEYPHRGE